MSENEIVCTECGRVRPTQVTVCPKHDFRHEVDKHCDHCENEVAQTLIESARKATQDLIDAGANSGT